MEWTVETLEETTAVARELVAQLTPTDTATVIALHGDLGAGKTTFVQSFAAALGVTDTVTSPTFVIMKGYDTNEPWEQLIHIDAYRIDDPTEMQPLGFSELCRQPHTIICVEWAERISELLPSETIHMQFTVVGENRIITKQHG